MAKRRTIVIYPHIGAMTGTGHIKRLLPFFSDDRFEAYITHRDPTFVKNILHNFQIDNNLIIPLQDLGTFDLNIDLILLDNKESDLYLYDRLKDIAPIVGIDEGGDSRNYIPYTIDIMPNLTSSKPNYFNPGLLELPQKNPPPKGTLNKILITFGGQDPFKLTNKIVEELSSTYHLTTVIGPLFTKTDFGVDKIVAPKDLKVILKDFDLVITSFGLTAYECIGAGIPVALYNPTEYHKKLAQKAKFYNIDTKKKISINYKKAIKVLNTVNTGFPEKLTDLVHNITPSNLGCPLCGRTRNKIINRFTDKSYFFCSHCSLLYMNYYKETMEYSQKYFFDDYKEQYGKTYLDDFDKIKDMGFNRLKHILRKLKKGDSILDIGCAYGPFLSAAKDRELLPYGIDPLESAVEYINNKLGIEAVIRKFPLKEKLPFPLPLAAVSMWYVIEHFRNLDSVLTQVNGLLKKGGVFCFSTPNLDGISGKKSEYTFQKNSPIDHYTLWTPKSAQKVLKDYGFKVYKVNITGHHPERFGKIANGFFMKKIILFVSKLFKLGDTFEIYSIKEHNL